MILIADSGSTKCDWVLIDGANRKEFSTMGFNPFFHSSDVITNAIKQNTELFAYSNAVQRLYLYSAGCSTKDLIAIVKNGLQNCFPSANILVEHDMLGAAYSTYSGTPGITCILGTGSNSCYFDGKYLNNDVPALGYILGDEGSGSYFGKKVIADFLYHKVPTELHNTLAIKYGISKEIIFDNVYKKPHANVYLASFMKIIAEHSNLEYVQDMVYEGMIQFLQNHVCCFENYQNMPTHFIGSIAHHFEDALRKAAKTLNVQIGKIIQKPIDGLVDYHLKYVV